MNGKGVFKNHDGTCYTGEFVENEFVDGKVTFKNTTGEYALTYKEGSIAEADIVFTDGTTYTGECKQSGIDGSGTMVFPNKDQFTGAFTDGKRSGKGTYQWNSGDSYDGEWDKDKMSGSGKYTYADGSYAEGTFEDSVFLSGTYYLKNDFGTYSFEIKNGSAVTVEMTLADGTKYSGKMSDGKLNGEADHLKQRR